MSFETDLPNVIIFVVFLNQSDSETDFPLGISIYSLGAILEPIPGPLLFPTFDTFGGPRNWEVLCVSASS